MPGIHIRPGSLATRLVHGVESLIIVVLLVLLGIVLAVATGPLVVTVVTDTMRTWNTAHSIDELTELRPVFSGFLLILIGLELMKTIAMYLADHVVQVEVVLTVAMIAVARHAIEIDYGNAGIGELVGTAALVMALTAGYYLYGRSRPLPEPAAASPKRQAETAGIDAGSEESRPSVAERRK
jgi:uncharacterized membrane protein (DUF373 family)